MKKSMELGVAMPLPLEHSNRATRKETRDILRAQLGKVVMEQAIKHKGLTISKPVEKVVWDEVTLNYDMMIRLRCRWK